MTYSNMKLAYGVETVMLGAFLLIVSAFTQDAGMAKAGFAVAVWGLITFGVAALRLRKE
jgi:hypothetical protein